MTHSFIEANPTQGLFPNQPPTQRNRAGWETWPYKYCSTSTIENHGMPPSSDLKEALNQEHPIFCPTLSHPILLPPHYSTHVQHLKESQKKPLTFQLSIPHKLDIPNLSITKCINY